MEIQNSAIGNVNFQSAKAVKQQEKATGAKISYHAENLVSGAVCLSAITMGILALKGKLKPKDISNAAETAAKEAAEKAAKEAAEKAAKEAQEAAQKYYNDLHGINKPVKSARDSAVAFVEHDAKEIINNGGSAKEARKLTQNLSHDQKKEIHAVISDARSKYLKEQQEKQAKVVAAAQDVNAAGGKIENLNQNIGTATEEGLEQIKKEVNAVVENTEAKTKIVVENAAQNPTHKNKINARRAENELTQAQNDANRTIKKAEEQAEALNEQAKLKEKHVAEQQASPGYEEGQRKLKEHEEITNANAAARELADIRKKPKYGRLKKEWQYKSDKFLNDKLTSSDKYESLLAKDMLEARSKK